MQLQNGAGGVSVDQAGEKRWPKAKCPCFGFGFGFGWSISI